MKKRNFRLTKLSILVFTLACALVFASGTSVMAAGANEVKIGNILPLSGPSASVGIQNQWAIELATD